MTCASAGAAAGVDHGDRDNAADEGEARLTQRQRLLPLSLPLLPTLPLPLSGWTFDDGKSLVGWRVVGPRPRLVVLAHLDASHVPTSAPSSLYGDGE